MRIACFGNGNGVPGDLQYEAMYQAGRLLGKAGHIVVTGAYGGVGMEAPARGATEAGGHVVGLTIGKRPGNVFLSETVDCSTIILGASFVEQYGIRLGRLLDEDAFIIAAGGGFGTLTELVAYLCLSLKHFQPLKRAALLTTGFNGAGWDMAMVKQILLWSGSPTLPIEDCLRIAHTPEAAVQWVCPK